MTVVTGISLYSDSGVNCVIAVTAQKFDEPTFACSLGAVLDAQRLQHLIGELAEILCDHIGRDLLLPHFGQQLRGRAYPFSAALHKVHHPKQKFRQLRLMNVLAVLALHQLPDKVVKLQGQFLIFHIPPTDQQRSGVSAALTAQNKVGVRSADDGGGAADIVKGIVLQRVNDDQLGGGMLGQEIRDLLLQPAADQPGGHGEIQVVRGAVGKIVEPVFDAALGVLKAQTEHIALQRGQAPNGISLRHLQPQPQHQLAFADLAGTADDIDTLRNKAVYDEHRLAHRRGQQGLCVHGFQFVVHRILLCRMLEVDFGGGEWKRPSTPALLSQNLGIQGFPGA